MDVAIAAPKGYACDPGCVEEARSDAAKNGSTVLLTTDPDEAVAGADVVYTDTWVSMGQEQEKAQRLAVFEPYRVDARRMAKANPDAIFLHCLPAYRGYEVTEDVIEGSQSAVFDEAENRLHAQKAVLVALLAGG
jgi:ornithine carbamoyltransferase